jgi:Tol biopolymer transport system component
MKTLAMMVGGLAVILGGIGWAQVTQRVSLDSGGAQGNDSSFEATVSEDGRYVAFASFASNLVPGDTNGPFYGVDVFVRDRRTGITERVSVSSGGAQGNDQSFEAFVSGNGRYVAFYSSASNLVPGDTAGYGDVFVHDRLTHTTERVSVSTGGAEGEGFSGDPSISADGRYVAFVSSAYNLVAGDNWNGVPDVFVRDRQNGTTECVSVVPSGGQHESGTWSVQARISADGRFVAFSTYATNILPGVVGARPTVYVRDRQTGAIDLVSVDMGGQQAPNTSGTPSISADGRFVAFMSNASTLVPGDTNDMFDVFVRDRQAATTERVSVDSLGSQSNGGSYSSSISADGRYVAFYSSATNLVPGDTNGWDDAFVHDRVSGLTERVSVASDGTQGNSLTQSSFTSMSADGRFVVFPSYSNNLVPGDTNGKHDIFVRDRLGGTSFTSLCEPGVGGVIPCPCSNPPSGPGRGCDNSSAEGGAVLSASGGTFLSSDSLVFTTSGERATSTSLVLQGTTSLPAGIVFGQGIRCVAGSLARLYSKTAVGGSVRVPDFGMHDQQVSVRSAALGDVILAGQSRWYFVYYRDVNVLGGCDAWRTFNATQTGQVTWWP